MPHTPDHEPRQRKGRTPKRSRGPSPTGGNRQTGKLRQAFQTSRKAVRGAANVVGQVGRAVTQETAGVAREVGRGLAGKAATPAGGGPQAATSQTAANRLGERARRLFSRGPGAPAAPTAVPSSASAPGAARAAATASFEAGQQGGRGAQLTRRAGRLVKGAGRLARGLALPGAAIALGTEALTTTQEEKERASGLPQIVPLRGTDPTAGGTTPAGQPAPVNLERFGDPILAGLRNIVGTARGAVGAGATQDISPTGEPVAPAPAAAGVRAPQFGAEGERSFTNADIGGGAANRGLRSVEENQAVAGRLDARGQAERAAGLRAAAQPGVGGAAEGSAAATALAQQAAGGGLASAFGALNLSGNQLRRQAADRTRANEAQVARTDAGNKLNLELTKIGAQSQVDRTKNLAKNAVGLVESVTKARESDDPQAEGNVRSAIFEAASAGNSPEADAAAANLVAENIREISGPNTLLGALFNPFDAFFKGERGPGDAISARGQGGFNNEFQNAVGKLVHNRSTGMLQIANLDGSGFQDVGSFDRLDAETREYLNDKGLRVIGEGQEITRGDPAVNDPTQPSF